MMMNYVLFWSVTNLLFKIPFNNRISNTYNILKKITWHFSIELFVCVHLKRERHIWDGMMVSKSSEFSYLCEQFHLKIKMLISTYSIV